MKAHISDKQPITKERLLKMMAQAASIRTSGSSKAKKFASKPSKLSSAKTGLLKIKSTKTL